MIEAALLSGVSDTFTLSAGLWYINDVTGVFKNPITFSDASEISATFNITKYSSVVSDSDHNVSFMETSNNSKKTIYFTPKGNHSKRTKKDKTTNMPYLNIYRPPMMLREGNFFIGVCLSFCWGGVLM